MTITDENLRMCCYEIFLVPSANGLIQSSPSPYLSLFLSPLYQSGNFKDTKSTKYSEEKGILNTNPYSTTGLP